jgi:hypothetical protein
MSCLQPKHGEYASGPMAVRHFTLVKNGAEHMIPHDHALPHTVVVYEGRLLAKTWCEAGCGEPREGEFGVGDTFLIDAHWMHVFEPVTEVAKGMCIFPARDPELSGAVVEYNGWK